MMSNRRKELCRQAYTLPPIPLHSVNSAFSVERNEANVGIDTSILRNEYSNSVIPIESRTIQDAYNIIEAKKLELLCQSLLVSPATTLVNLLPSSKTIHYPNVNASEGFSALGRIKPEMTYGIDDALRNHPITLSTCIHGALTSLHSYSISAPLISAMVTSGTNGRSNFPFLHTLSGKRLQFHNSFSSPITECNEPDKIKNPQASNQDPQKFESFPIKLYRLLFEFDRAPGHEEIVQFLPDGNAFEILDLTLFKDVLMKRYFPRMKSFASFQRQLNNYCFRRHLYFPDRMIYHHPKLHRDYPSLCRKIKRCISRMRNNEI